MNDTLTQALELAERGYHLFPLVPGGKTPALTGNWQNAATRDPRTLQRWFARSNCNIAIACEPSGIFAIDLDTAKPGTDGPTHGIETLRELADGRDLPRTLTVATPSGGTHLYYRQPVDGLSLRNSARRLGPLIDTRGIGGYLVAPGSRIDGVPYRVTDDVPLAEIPTWITALLRPPEPGRETPRAVQQVPAEIGSPYARAALGRETARVATAKPGQRNHTLNQAAYNLGRLIADGLLDRTQVESQLTHAAQAAGLGRAETEATLNSGITAGLEHHRARAADVTSALSSPSQVGGATAVPSVEPRSAAAADAGSVPQPSPVTLPPKTLAALHTALDTLDREIGETAAVSITPRQPEPKPQRNLYEPSPENAADFLDQAVSTVRNVEPRAQALARTPEWHKIRAISHAAADLTRQIRQAARDHAEDLRTDIYIHGAIRTITARACRQIAELSSVAADRLAHRGLTESPTYADLRTISRAAQRAETKLTGRLAEQSASDPQIAARRQLKALRRDLRTASRTPQNTTPPRPTTRTATRPIV